jgi:hypothetical protein
MVATAVLADFTAFLGAAALVPTPQSIGVAEPAANGELPALAMSLRELQVPEPAFERQPVLIQSGALAVTSVIDLANPVLADDPTVTLLSPDRLRLMLPQGGLVTVDGTEDPLAAADVQVQLDGAPLTLTAGAPAAGQFAVEAIGGVLTFGAALAAAGALTATYHLGRWERSLERLAGLLDIAVVGSDNATTNALSDAVLVVLAGARAAIPGVRQLDAVAVGPVAVFEALPGQGRVRRLVWRFDYERVIDRPDSSGGVIQRIRARSHTENAAPGQQQVQPEQEDIT